MASGTKEKQNPALLGLRRFAMWSRREQLTPRCYQF
jgi:hypothetical protein